MGRRLAQRGRHARQAEQRHPRRGQLDRQRAALECATDRRRMRCTRRILGIEPEPALQLTHALLEQRDRGRAKQSRRVGILGRQCQAAQAQHLLGSDAQRHLARRDHPHLRGARQQCMHGRNHPQRHGIGVVQRHHHLQRRHRRSQRLLRVRRAKGHPERRGHRRQHVGVVRQRREVDPAGVAPLVVGQPLQQVAHEQRLADAAGPSDGDEPATAQQGRKLGKVDVAADQPCQRCRQGRPRRRQVPAGAPPRLHRQGESVAAPGDRGDRVRPDHPPQRPDLHLEVVGLDHEARPDPIEQLVARQRALGLDGQHRKQVEGAAAQPGRRTVDQQPAPRRLQLEAAGGAEVDRLHLAPSLRHGGELKRPAGPAVKND